MAHLKRWWQNPFEMMKSEIEHSMQIDKFELLTHQWSDNDVFTGALTHVEQLDVQTCINSGVLNA
jgi:hypothetical protein